MHVPSYVADLHSTPNWMNQQLQGSVQLILNNYQMTKYVLELTLLDQAEPWTEQIVLFQAFSNPISWQHLYTYNKHDVCQ